MLRIIISVLFAVVFLIGSLPLLGIVALTGLFRPKARTRAAVAIIRWAFRVCLALAGTKLNVTGRENIPKGRAALYAGNHRSIYDVIIAYTLIPSPAGIVAKDSLSKIPVFSIWAKFICCLFLDRNDLRSGMKMIQDGTQYLSEGVSMFICPEGTRNKGAHDLPLLPFHEGSFRMATKCDAPVVPIAIGNASQIWEAHPKKIVPTEVTVTFCAPIETSSLDRSEKKQLGTKCMTAIEEALQNSSATRL